MEKLYYGIFSSSDEPPTGGSSSSEREKKKKTGWMALYPGGWVDEWIGR